MRHRFPSLAAGLLFLLYSTNAYACLSSMTPAAASMDSMGMEMPSSDASPPCPIVKCDAAAIQRTAADCQLSSAAAELGGLTIAQPVYPAPGSVVLFGGFAPDDASAAGRSIDPPPPPHSLPLFLLHAALRL